jgi:hypothetical protein
MSNNDVSYEDERAFDSDAATTTLESQAGEAFDNAPKRFECRRVRCPFNRDATKCMDVINWHACLRQKEL